MWGDGRKIQVIGEGEGGGKGVGSKRIKWVQEGDLLLIYVFYKYVWVMGETITSSKKKNLLQTRPFEGKSPHMRHISEVSKPG